MFSERGSVGDSLRKHGFRVGKKTTKKSYQRFFDGWVEYREKDGRGREHTRMLYVADYHVCDTDMKGRVFARILYLALTAAAAALFVTAGIRETSFNMTWYVGAPIAAASLCLSWMAVVLVVFYIPNIIRMTNFTFKKGVKSLKEAAKFSVYALTACAVMTIFSLLFHQDDLFMTFLCTLQYVFAAAAVFQIYHHESGISYHLEASGNKAPLGAVYIATMEEVLPPKSEDTEEKRVMI